MVQFNHQQPKQDSEQVRNSIFRAFSLFILRLWRFMCRGNPPDLILAGLGLVTSLMMAIPIFYVIWRSLHAGADRWLQLLDARIPMLLWNTLSLTVGVTFLAVCIGVSLAWFVIRSDLFGNKTWSWLLALPLVVPPYVGAMTYIILLGPRGWFRELWNRSDVIVNGFGEYPLQIYSFTGLMFVLTMFTYPYVFLITSAALKKMNRSYEDVARSHGLGTHQIFWKVYIPLLRRAIGAGAILISLYVLSDFGAIAMLRYTTFTSAIYYQMGSYDNVTAAVLSVVLIVITIIFLYIESRTRRKQSYVQTSNSFVPLVKVKLGKWKPYVTAYVAVIFVLSFLMPVIVLGYWSWVGLLSGALDSKFWVYAWNSFAVSSSAAVLSIVLALPIIYLKSRYPSYFSTWVEKLSYSGYALPGVIVALGIIYIFNQYIPWMYNTAALITVAYLIRFLPQAMQAGESTLSMISPRIDETARSLGYPPWKVMFKVILPMMIPGLLAGGALVFVSSIKELPATLLLRPPGFDTLSVRVWVEAGESIYHLAAPAALLIVLISIVPLRYLIKSD